MPFLSAGTSGSKAPSESDRLSLFSSTSFSTCDCGEAFRYLMRSRMSLWCELGRAAVGA
jgi:hypothetical protein